MTHHRAKKDVVEGLWPFVLQVVAPICASFAMIGIVYRIFGG